MARREVFRVEGLKQVDQALRDLPRATRKNVVQRGLIDAGKPIAQDAASRVRKRTGALAKSFTKGISTKLSRRQKAKHKKQSAVEVFIGPGTHPQAITEEFGTARQSPHPSLRPAWDAGRMDVLDSLKGFFEQQIEAARARLARKAARKAAKS